MARPDMAGVLGGFVPTRARSSRNPAMLYIAIGILGATVMPHNLYLHSSIVQTRKVLPDADAQARGDPLRHHRLDRGAAVRASSSTRRS